MVRSYVPAKGTQAIHSASGIGVRQTGLSTAAPVLTVNTPSWVKNDPPPAHHARDERILLLLTTSNDAELARSVLADAHYKAEVCRDIEELCRGVQEGTGVVLVAEEALTPPALGSLGKILGQQPPWSDLPLLVLTSSVKPGKSSVPAVGTLDLLANATFLERPLRVATLLQSSKVALNARRRQYEIREHLRERELAAAEHLALLERQRAFLRDVLFSVTEGKLSLCEGEGDLPPRFSPVGDPIELGVGTLKSIRRRTAAAADSLGFAQERQHDLLTGVSEAAMNAVVHAGGGIGMVGASPTGTVQVWIEDQGAGIDMERLPRATLERGFSSAGTLGHGFWLILQSCDRVYLMTNSSGSTLVLEQDRETPQPDWLG